MHTYLGERQRGEHREHLYPGLRKKATSVPGRKMMGIVEQESSSKDRKKNDPGETAFEELNRRDLRCGPAIRGFHLDSLLMQSVV